MSAPADVSGEEPAVSVQNGACPVGARVYMTYRVSAGAHNRREDHSTAASATDTTDTTRPITHPWECCEPMIAAMRTPIPIMPAVATTRISGASSGRRFRRLGIITPGRSAAASLRSLRSARLASRSAPS